MFVPEKSVHKNKVGNKSGENNDLLVIFVCNENGLFISSPDSSEKPAARTLVRSRTCSEWREHSSIEAVLYRF